MHTSPNAPAADAGKQANDPSSTVTDHEPSALKVTKASIDAFAFVALDASHPRLPTLAEARTYWVLSRS